MGTLTPEEQELLTWHWRFWARPEQIAPDGDWLIWLALAGRGWGKTRTGAGWVNEIVEQSGRGFRIALIGPTSADVRDVMIGGESGIVNTSPPWNKAVYYPSKRLVEWPCGAQALAFSAEEPERLRGPQFHAGWCDELCAWSELEATWDMYQFGLRLGTAPKTFISTTPKPVKLLIEWVKKHKAGDQSIVITRGKTTDNAANLASVYLKQVTERYGGTALGKQELDGEILEESQRALWKRTTVDAHRESTKTAPSFPDDYERIVVAIDPAVTSGDRSDETGIVVVGKAKNGHYYVLKDLSGRYKPHEWADKAITSFHAWHADRLIGEANNGGDMIETVIRACPGGDDIPYRKVIASRGKHTRAEPVAALYEQGKVHHVGTFDALESQLFTFDPLEGQKSPDRLDALVWAITELALSGVPHKFW